MLYYNMSYISPFNDMQNLDENNHEFINQNTYKISQYNVVEEDYIVNYGQGSEAEPEHNFLPLNTSIINGLFTNDKQEETEKNKGLLITLPNKTVPNSSGDLRSPTISILPMLSTPTPTISSIFTPTPTPPTPSATVQPTYTSTPTPSSNVIYTPAPCGFSTSHNKHLQSAYDSLHQYDISGAFTALNKEIVRRSVYVERLQPNSSKEVKSYNMDIIAKLNMVLKDLENDTPNLADDLNTICMIKPFSAPQHRE